MTISIAAVPESITRETYLGLIYAAGLNPCDISEMKFTGKGIYATVLARGDDGRRVIDWVDGGDTCAKHEVFVPIKD